MELNKIKNHDKIEIAADFCEYAFGVLNFSIKEAEKSVTLLFDIILKILDEVNRVSSLSERTKEVLTGLKTSIQQRPVADWDIGSLQSSLEFLKSLDAASSDAASRLMPIMDALQFQDRTRQQMENLTKMLLLWKDERFSAIDFQVSQSDYLAFIQKLKSVTTTPEEAERIAENVLPF